MTNITLALPEDAEAILSLQRLAYQSEARIYNDFEIPPLMQTLSELEQEIAEKVVLKSLIGSEIVGSVRAYQERTICHIERLIVHPDWQRKGIATALMEQVENRFADVEKFELFTGDKSEGNIRLYQRLGYEIFKSEEINPNLSFVFMEKRR